MAAIERFLGDEGVELYGKAKHLSEEESKNDPQDEPYRSKYKAREVLKEIRGKLEDKICSGEKSKSLLALTLCIDQLIGLNHMDTEELAEGEDYLASCLKSIQENNVDNETSLQINIHNQLGILWSERGSIDSAMEHFVQAEKLYHDFKKNVGDAPHAYREHLEPLEGNDSEKSHERCRLFESLHTHTLYYLAQVYAKKEKNSLSAHYCHVTLQRQLRAGDYNPVDWGLNAATLSQYYLGAEKYNESRHCLSSGSLIFESSKKNKEELSEEELEIQLQREADIERCWIKYGLALLESSRDQMLSEIHDSEETTEGQEPKQGNHNEEQVDATGEGETQQSDSDKPFEEFELELTQFEEKVTDKFVRIFDDARRVFLFIVDKINNARKFYDLDTHASDAVEIIQDHSKAYKLLSFFELDISRQCRMQKRRIDMLTDLLKELNPQYYLLVNRQLMYELAETFSTMVDLKISLIEMDQARPTPHSTAKINKLISQSIDKYQAYIDSLKGGKAELPPEFPEGDVRPGLVAFFCMGRLYSKFLEPEIPRRIAAIKKSLECYQFVVDYCRDHPKAEELVPSELSICREMITLLPLKMQRLRDQN